MPRSRRVAPGGYVYHVLNRGVGRLVNEPQHETEVKSLRKCVVRAQPFGSDSWVAATADQLGLQYTLRNRGRPAKPTETKPGH